MASKTQMSSASKNRRGSYCSKACTIIASLVHLALLHHVLLFLLTAMTMPGPAESLLPTKRISITNNHTKLLTVRCFTFYDEDRDSPGTRRMHLQPGQSYSFLVEPRGFYPSSAMYNCSTNMGVFVAYRYDYSCSRNWDPRSACEWMFDEKQTYFKNKNGIWKAVDYHPNYESLGRGGVVKGYFTN